MVECGTKLSHIVGKMGRGKTAEIFSENSAKDVRNAITEAVASASKDRHRRQHNHHQQQQQQHQQSSVSAAMAVEELPRPTTLDPVKILDTMSAYIEDKGWWVFIVGFDMTDVLDRIETQYYSHTTTTTASRKSSAHNRKNEVYFHVMMLPFPVIAVAAKSMMSYDQLSRTLVMQTGRAWTFGPDSDMVPLINKGDRLGEMACERLMRQVRNHMAMRQRTHQKPDSATY